LVPLVVQDFIGSIMKLHVPFDRFPQRTIDWLSLPVLADPFWGRAAFSG
jgi:hypothetical protein